MRKRVLVICMFDSIHSARWLGQFADQDVHFLLFPSSPHRKLHKNLLKLLGGETRAKYSIFPFSRYFGLPLWILDKFLNNLFRGTLVRKAITKFKPDVIHALELQNAGYIAARALRGKKPNALRFIATNWGSDIYWFRQFPKHEAKLRELLALADAYSCECHRDVRLAQELGFVGRVMPVIPNAGGFPSDVLERPVAALADRKVIAVKGYHGWVGRAKVALAAIETLASDLDGYRIVVYSANRTTIRLARRVAKVTGLEFEIHGKGQLSHEQVLDLFASARLYVGLSLSDGISTSLLEAMAMGAIPVQTSTACCDEWFVDTGVAVSAINTRVVAEAISKALRLSENQELSDRNREIIRVKARAENVAEIAKAFYSS